MHIGFDISQTGSCKAGCGYFAHGMIKALLEIDPEHCYTLYPSFGDFYFDAKMTFFKTYSSRNLSYGTRHFTLEAAREFWNSISIEDSLGKPDVVHANNFWCPIHLASSRLIYTFHDMGFAVEPSWTTETNRIGCFEGVFRSSILADWIVAVSEASRQHYTNIFPHFPKERIRVIYPCSRFNNSKEIGCRPKALKGLIAGKFWLTVSTIEPRKNQQRLAIAYKKYLNSGGKQWPLVMAGGNGWLMDDFPKKLEELGIANHVIMTGYVSDKELIWLYRNCYANLFPSLFEGFGLPVLEGMQFGSPTIASKTSSIPEVTGTAAILLDPRNEDEWFKAMLGLSCNSSKRDKMSDDSKKQADKFDWKHSAMALLELYEDAKKLPKRKRLII